MRTPASPEPLTELVQIPAGDVLLTGDLTVPSGVRGVVLFAHGSGSGRHSPRNCFVAGRLNEAGLATLLLDLLTEEEEAVDVETGHLRFNVRMLAERLADAATWLEQHPATTGLPLGFFGASTGAGAALIAAAGLPRRVAAVVSRGGRPDLAGPALRRVRCPTLLIVGGADGRVIGLNEDALERLAAPAKRLEIIPGATHLFEEPGALEEVARLASDWFTHHLRADEAEPDPSVPWEQVVYRDRRDAGRALAASLSEYAGRSDLLVLALPRGGVPVGYEVARRLGAPLDVFVVRKLGAPGYEELALGAIASGGVRVLNEEAIEHLDIDLGTIDAVTERERRELARRERIYRGDRPSLQVAGLTVIVVDDGLATGSTMRAAVAALQQMRPHEIVVAVPVGSADTCEMLRHEADRVVCCRTPEPLLAVGHWYEDFTQTSDEDVRKLLAEGRQLAPTESQ